MLVCVAPLSQDKGVKTNIKTSENSFPVLRQICNPIPHPMFAEVCAGLQAGEIVLFDKAHLDLRHLSLLDGHGVHWVMRA